MINGRTSNAKLYNCQMCAAKYHTWKFLSFCTQNFFRCGVVAANFRTQKDVNNNCSVKLAPQRLRKFSLYTENIFDRGRKFSGAKKTAATRKWPCFACTRVATIDKTCFNFCKKKGKKKWTEKKPISSLNCVVSDVELLGACVIGHIAPWWSVSGNSNSIFVCILGLTWQMPCWYRGRCPSVCAPYAVQIEIGKKKQMRI